MAPASGTRADKAFIVILIARAFLLLFQQDKRLQLLWEMPFFLSPLVSSSFHHSSLAFASSHLHFSPLLVFYLFLFLHLFLNPRLMELREILKVVYFCRREYRGTEKERVHVHSEFLAEPRVDLRWVLFHYYFSARLLLFPPSLSFSSFYFLSLWKYVPSITCFKNPVYTITPGFHFPTAFYFQHSYFSGKATSICSENPSKYTTRSQPLGLFSLVLTNWALVQITPNVFFPYPVQIAFY